MDKFIEAGPNMILGTVSLTLAVELMCLAHLIVCIAFFTSASSAHWYNLAGVHISPFVQCVNAAWFLLGLPVIVLAGAGAVYRIENHLKYYLYYLGGSLTLAIVWLATFAKHGSVCRTYQPTFGSEVSATFACAVTNGFVLFWMLVLVTLALYAIFLVWSLREYIRNRTETELFRYQEPWQRTHMVAEDCRAEEIRKGVDVHNSLAQMSANMWGRTPAFVP